MNRKDLITTYIQLLNGMLPATYTHPVRFNHCFNRIVLDWLFQDCWYNCLSRRQTAISQLSEEQLHQAVGRMQLWLREPQVLIADNEASLRYRGKKPWIQNL